TLMRGVDPSALIIPATNIAVGIDVDAIVQINNERSKKRLESSAGGGRQNRKVQVQPDTIVAPGGADEILRITACIRRQRKPRTHIRWAWTQNHVLEPRFGLVAPVGIRGVER